MAETALERHPLAIALPTGAIAFIRAFQQDGLTGQIVLNYNHGEIQSYSATQHERVKGER